MPPALLRPARRVHAEVRLAAFARESNLFFAFGKATPLGIGLLRVAGRTTNPGPIMLALFVLLGNRPAAGMALIVTAFLQRLVDADPVVENETFAVPARVFRGHFLEVLQNAAPQVVNLVETLLLQVRGRFLAADSTGAKHCDLAVFLRIQMPPRVLGKIPKRCGIGVERVSEAADRGFVVITGVDQGDLGVADQLVPVGRADIGARVGRVEILDAHGDDFFLQLDPRPVKRHFDIGRKLNV